MLPPPLLREIKQQPKPSLEPAPAPAEEIFETGWTGDQRVPDRWYLALDLLLQGYSVEQAAQKAQMTGAILRAILDESVPMRQLMENRTQGLRWRTHLLALARVNQLLADEDRSRRLSARELAELLRATRPVESVGGGPSRKIKLDVWED